MWFCSFVSMIIALRQCLLFSVTRYRTTIHTDDQSDSSSLWAFVPSCLQLVQCSWLELARVTNLLLSDKMFIAHAQHCAHNRVTIHTYTAYTALASVIIRHVWALLGIWFEVNACVGIVWYKDIIFKDSRKLETATFASHSPLLAIVL